MTSYPLALESLWRYFEIKKIFKFSFTGISLEVIRTSEIFDKSAVYLDKLKYLVPVRNGKLHSDMTSLISKFNISDVSHFRITSDSEDFTDEILRDILANGSLIKRLL